VTPVNGGSPLTFTSTTPDVKFTGLTPATQVNYRRCCRCCCCCCCCSLRVGQAAVATNPVLLPLAGGRVESIALPAPCCLQYEVSVVGTKTDGTTPKSNTLRFVTPAAG